MATPRIWLTDAGAAAFRDDSNVGTEAITFTKLAYGTGVGPQTHADARARAALRTQRGTVPLIGRDSSGGRFLLRGDVPAARPGYAITELGVLAQIGTDPEFLALYGAVPDAVGDDVFGHVTPSTELVVPLSVDIVGMDAAFSAAVNATIQVADVPQATEAVVGKSRFATEAEAKAGALTDVGVSPARLAAVLSLITVLHFSESDPNYAWNLPFSRALVVMKGADSGGGGGGGSRGGADGTGGGPGGQNGSLGQTTSVPENANDVYRPYNITGSRGGGGGGRGTAGGRTSITVGGVTHVALGGGSARGGGGGGGRGTSALYDPGPETAGNRTAYADGGNGGDGADHPDSGGARGGRRVGNATDGLGTYGAAGGAATSQERSGGDGEPPKKGEVKAVVVSGLSANDPMPIQVGAAGRGGGGGRGRNNGADGPDGTDGWVRIVPLPDAA